MDNEESDNERKKCLCRFPMGCQ